MLNVTNMTNSAAIGGQLQDAKAGKPRRADPPDLFSAHPRGRQRSGHRTLWTGTTGSPPRTWRPMCPALCRTVSLTGSRWCSRCPNPPSFIFERLSTPGLRRTPGAASTLATWDGFFEWWCHRQWSQGKPFCALTTPASGGAERAGTGQRRAVQGQLVRSDQRDLPRFVDGICPGTGAGRYSARICTPTRR